MRNLFIAFILLAFSSIGWLACESSSVATNEEISSESTLAELEALIESASKTADQTDYFEFADRTEHPCYNADSAAVRHEAKAAMTKFQAEIAALTFNNWSDNSLIKRVNTLQNKKLEGLAKFQEARGLETAVLSLPVGEYNIDSLDALFVDLSQKIAISKTEALFALGYTQELLLVLNHQKMEGKRANMEALRSRMGNGGATACDSARVANFRERMQEMQQNGVQAQRGNDQGKNGIAQSGRRARTGGPMLLKYIVKFLENDGIIYEAQIIDAEVLDRIVNASPSQNTRQNHGKGNRPPSGQGRKG